MNEMRREQIREVRREKIKELNKMRGEEKEEKDNIEVIAAKIKIEIKNLIKLQDFNIGKIESQMRIYPKGNEALHELEARKQILEEEITKLKELFHISSKIEEELKSKHLLPVEVCEMFKTELENARRLLVQCRTDFSHFGGASSRIVWGHNTIPGAIRVERNLENKKVQNIEHQARM